MSPFFSIIIPTHNRAHLIKNAIASVIVQTYADFELIIVDDGSSDTTTKVINGFHDDRIKLVFQNNKGASSARNKGASVANGLYLIFLDSDDELSDEILENYAHVIKSKYPELVLTDKLRFNLKGESCINKAIDPHNVGIALNVLSPGSYCIKKSLFMEVNGFDEQLKYGENTELQYRLFRKKREVSFINTIGVTHYFSLDGSSKNLENIIESNNHIINKHYDYFKIHKNELQIYLEIMGVAFVKIKQIKKARSYFFKAFLVNPFQFKSFIRLIVSNMPFLPNVIWKNNEN